MLLLIFLKSYLLGAVWDPFVDERSTAPEVVEVGVENRRGKIESPGPADFGDLLWNALFRPDSTKCLKINRFNFNITNNLI